MRDAFRTARLIAAVVAVTWPAAITSEAQESASCIAIVVPAAEGIAGNAAEVETAVRDLLVKQLSDPSVKVVALEARMKAPAIDEARKTDCGHVLLTTMRRNAAGSGGAGGLLGKVAEGAGRSAAWSIPGSGIAGGVARGAALSGVDAVIAVASSTKARDEIGIEYQLVAASGATVAGPQAERAKARSDGEDLLTPLVRRIAERVHAALTKR